MQAADLMLGADSTLSLFFRPITTCHLLLPTDYSGEKAPSGMLV
jgi:hypothetical protein